MFVNVCYDELNLSQPALVQEVHEAYVQAGAEILETNTFGANPVKLSSHGLEDETEVINRTRGGHRAPGGRTGGPSSSARSARWASGWSPGDQPPGSEAIGFFSRQARGLLEGEVDGFILETFSDLHELRGGAVRREGG